MSKEDDDREAEWLEQADTFISGSIPIDVSGDDETTTPRRTLCLRCLRPVKTGGDAARPTFEELEVNSPDVCWRSMGADSGRGWWWCSARRPYVLMLTG